ncbi:MAG: tetratricopeptide repeat protein, partial [Candidatus Latescibacterota bacterium]
GAILAELERARRIGAAVDSTMNACATDPVLAAAVARRDLLAAAVDSLRASEVDVRAQVAAAVAARGRDRLEREREAIDYHLADASYELAVGFATDPATAEDTTVVGPARRRAIARVGAFLDRHRESFARGESRYRLADLLLMQARDDFQAKMARFVGGESPEAADMGNRALAPFVDYAPVVALYEAILEEDAGYPHVDAVLFNLGMILSDDGRPEATGYLTRLVEQYPDSPDCQEAWLRMASDRFDRKDYAGCVAMFEEAAAGRDSSFTAIALYKMGWAQFELDRFDRSVDAFRRLMDLYEGNSGLAAKTDLREEAEEYLVHSLARAGGAGAFRAYFDGLGGRVYEPRVLMSLGHLTRSVSLYEEAAACDRLWLERYPLHPKSLAVAERLVDTYQSWNKPDEARAVKLALADGFLRDGQWFQANRDPGLREAAERFAQSAYRETAAYNHRRARETDDAEAWRLALDGYGRFLDHWPDDADSYRMHFFAGDAAAHLGEYDVAAGQFLAAARSDSTALALDASWQHVAVVDSWYRSSQPAGGATEPGGATKPGGAATPGADSLAARLLAAGDRYRSRFPGDERCRDILWRQGNVAYAHGWYAEAGAFFEEMGERYPRDSRAVVAVRMSGDAHYKRADYEAAGAAYEFALLRAAETGADSAVAGLETAVPLCYYKHAEGVAAADTVDGEKDAARLFERIARRWPRFEHADLALYRAGLGYAADSRHADAAAAWEALLATYPGSEYTRDAAIQIALVHDRAGDTVAAARAYERFSRLHPDDPDAPAALLKSADLLAAAGDETGAERVRSSYIDQFPGDVETAMEIRADRAARELAGVTAGASTLASLLGPGGGSSSELKSYLALAAANPELASPRILAQVDFMKAEEAHPAYAAIRLTQPLPESIEKKKQKMESLVAMYDRCAGHGVSEYSRAAAHRIGQVLIEFGDALAESERPSGLSDDDLLAYEDVLEEQSWEFFDRGENAWSELLRQVGDAPDDPGGWIARTREALWPRLAWRFLYRPEVEYPLVAASPPSTSGAN